MGKWANGPQSPPLAATSASSLRSPAWLALFALFAWCSADQPREGLSKPPLANSSLDGEDGSKQRARFPPRPPAAGIGTIWPTLFSLGLPRLFFGQVPPWPLTGSHCSASTAHITLPGTPGSSRLVLGGLRLTRPVITKDPGKLHPQPNRTWKRVSRPARRTSAHFDWYRAPLTSRFNTIFL